MSRRDWSGSPMSPGLVAIADVTGDRQAAPAGVFDQSPRLGGVVVLLQIRARDVGALAGEGDRHRAPDSRIGARDEADSVLEAPMADVALLAVVGRLAHLALVPGRLLLLLGEGRRRLGVGGVLLLVGHGRVIPRAR